MQGRPERLIHDAHVFGVGVKRIEPCPGIGGEVHHKDEDQNSDQNEGNAGPASFGRRR